MPSQEDYLDQLLKGISDEPELQEVAVDVPEFDMSMFEMSEEEMAGLEVTELQLPEEEPEDVTSEDITSEDIEPAEEVSEEDILKKMVRENATIEDVLSDDEDLESAEAEPFMSEDEIEQILAENNTENADVSLESQVDEDADLMSLLEAASAAGGDLQDIHDMLQKADNDEAIEEELMTLLQGDEEVDEIALLQAEMEGAASEENSSQSLSEKEKKAIEKKKIKEEKAAAKRAAKEAKRAEKEAQRASKKAAKETAKGDSEEAVYSDETVLPSQEEAGSVVTDASEADAGMDSAMAADMQEIDELLSLAGISAFSEDENAAVEAENNTDVSDILMLDENEIGDLIPEKEKKGLFTRILDFLTETDEDEDEVKGTENIPLSDENKNILDEMDKEEKSSGKKKGKKVKKDKKGKKAATEPADMESGEEAEDAKGKKAKKTKKPKKEKEQHLNVLPVEDSKNKLSKKTMFMVGGVCASVLVLIMLLVNLGGDFAVKREAKKAYYREDYETCYQVLYGKKLNESEKVMFAKSESILRMNLRLREYEIFAEEDSVVEALDVLIQTVYDYAEIYKYASKWNAGEDVSVVYSQMLGILQEKYHLTESDALEIAAEPDDVEYTRLVTAVAEGKKYISPRNESEKPAKTVNLPDMLPEEKKFPENNGG